MQPTIPDKLYFKIGEVGKLAQVPTHVLRYWETEFKGIKPKRASSKQRLYRRQDVELILRIKTLLHEQGYTIAGARKLIESGEDTSQVINQQVAPPTQHSPTAPSKTLQILGQLKRELMQLQSIINKVE